MAQQDQSAIPDPTVELRPVDTTTAKELSKVVIDSLSQLDSTSSKKKVFIPVPKKAALLALAIPGGGQIYNRDYWKLPLVYGAFGGMIYAIDYNSDFYTRFRDALIAERAGEPHEFDDLNIGNEQSLLNKRNEFDKNRQLAYVGLVLVYALTAVEAFVDAHLRNFDIEDDLTWELKPQFEQLPLSGQTLIGVGLSIPLDRKSKTAVPVSKFGF